MIKTIKETYLDFYKFFKNPIDQISSNQTFKEKLIKLFLILLLDLVLSGIFVLLLAGLEKLGFNFANTNKLFEFIKSLPLASILILLVVIVPFLEELVFRLPLRYKTNYLFRLFVLLSYVAGKENKERFEKAFLITWNKHYKYFFYFLTVLFGLVHSFNYDLGLEYLLIIPLLTLPQFVTGIFLGYLRVRYNLFLSILLHAFHNLILFLPILITGGIINITEENNDKHYLKIDAIATKQSDNKSYGFMSKDSVFFKNYSLLEAVAYTHNTDKWLVESNDYQKSNVALNLVYKNKMDSNSVDKALINDHLFNAFHFKITKENRSTIVWDLRITDSLKLYSQKADSIKGISLNMTNNYISGVIDFKNMVSILKSQASINIYCKYHIDGYYNIRLNTSDREEMKVQLDSLYGIKLVDSMAVLEYIIVDFDKNN